MSQPCPYETYNRGDSQCAALSTCLVVINDPPTIYFIDKIRFQANLFTSSYIGKKKFMDFTATKSYFFPINVSEQNQPRPST